ncbi:MAG TPA: FAD-binding oxidoreductase, partial [Acidimicrobiales bacterium]|nr:FAD-binding oxidoreductase [Acidimicrobiales bacterium]
VDPTTGLVTVGAGATLGEVLASVVPAGWMLPVVPGTRHVTVGGAVASDVHGKNHGHAGSFADWVTRLRLLTPEGPRDLDPHDDRRVFWATAGGMGLTGIVSRATLRLVPLTSTWFDTITWRTDSLADTLRVMDLAGDQHVLAWLDPSARSTAVGRGVVTAGRPATTAPRGTAAPAPNPRALTLPTSVPVARSALVRAMSAARWRTTAPGPTERPLQLDEFLFPLDRFASWNRLFGRRGLVQWQAAVPNGTEDALEEMLLAPCAHGTRPSLVSLKRLGGANGGPLSFPMAGWTLALDFPAAARDLWALLDRLDAITVVAGGRVYLAKDARLRPATFRAMYPRVEEWCAIRSEIDPKRTMGSDLARRLHLVEATA